MQIGISSCSYVLLILTQNFPFKERIFSEMEVQSVKCRMPGDDVVEFLII